MIDLQRFCAGPDSLAAKHGLGAPWSQGDWTYASNRHVLVRVPRRADVPAGGAETPAGAPAIFAMHAAAELAPFLGLELPAAADCSGDVFCEEGNAACDACRSVALRGGLFALEYVRLIVELPALQLARQAPACTDRTPRVEPAVALRFTFGGDEPGEGLLMPRSERARHHLDVLEGDLLGAHRREGGA